MLITKLALATGIAVSLAGCVAYPVAVPPAPPATSEAPAPTATVTEPPTINPEAEFYGDLAGAFPDQMESRDVRQSALNLAYNTCENLGVGGSFDNIMAIIREASPTEDILAFQTTVVYLGVTNFCPEYSDLMDEWINE